MKVSSRANARAIMLVVFITHINIMNTIIYMSREMIQKCEKMISI
jgi:hypothetical protein